MEYIRHVISLIDAKIVKKGENFEKKIDLSFLK